VLPGALAGVSLLPDAAGGSHFLTATSTGLQPGTNYTVLAAVRLAGSGAGAAQAASPTVVALTGLLVPDTAPPTFTKAVVKAVTPGTGGNGSSTAVGATSFSIQLDLGLNEDGRVYYAVYGDPACITSKCGLPVFCLHQGGNSPLASSRDTLSAGTFGDTEPSTAKVQCLARATAAAAVRLSVSPRTLTTRTHCPAAPFLCS
jgi:hypothetical protein